MYCNFIQLTVIKFENLSDKNLILRVSLNKIGLVRGSDFQIEFNQSPFFFRLRVYDGFTAKTELTPARGLYGKYSKGEYEFSSGDIHDYTSTGQGITLYFVGDPSATFDGFKALLTVIKGKYRCHWQSY